MRNRFNTRRSCNCNCRNCQNRCRPMDVMPANPLLANAYVPYQEVEEVFTPMEALEHGTAFPELVSPYCPNQSQEIIRYLRGTSTCGEGDCNGM